MGPLDASLLLLPSGSCKHSIIESRMTYLRAYVNTHAESWCKFYTSRSKGQMIPKGSLKMVTTCYTSRVWALASYSSGDLVQPKGIYAKLFKVKEDRDLYHWKCSPGVISNTGPTTEEMKDDRALHENQCVALEVHSIQIEKKRVGSAIQSIYRTFSNLSMGGSRSSVAH